MKEIAYIKLFQLHEIITNVKDFIFIPEVLGCINQDWQELNTDQNFCKFLSQL